jgi:hypothetical protein
LGSAHVVAERHLQDTFYNEIVCRNNGDVEIIEGTKIDRLRRRAIPVTFRQEFGRYTIFIASTVRIFSKTVKMQVVLASYIWNNRQRDSGCHLALANTNIS